MQNLSAFRPTHPQLYRVYVDSSVVNSLELSETKEAKNTREWADLTTMYIMLKYRKWQLKERRTVSLHVFHQRCTEEMLNELSINKTATQIRDKVNNTRSSFHSLLKQSKNGGFKWVQEKHSSLTKNVYDFMCAYFDPLSSVSLDLVESKLASVILMIRKQE
ncbi:hypothetical protein EIN_281550 [Entamoeba invadens IP1]|uniref:Uncharacterized protein n=1 Tax=Entamoeba invadens IP1 TaxID=370355 RepID=A0A0A1U2L5_ENTIV|nr:hypothetical protein EIN_281550 [Entamoeba invadens IP1]ELP85784.1 hypothetical protein EIN_281550 [Entamoeba invadens IP1]|eukprot:XP_004185130.1 hypothetical protein EIN_281550 [Entamoeba invadens IP1]